MTAGLHDIGLCTNRHTKYQGVLAISCTGVVGQDSGFDAGEPYFCTKPIISSGSSPTPIDNLLKTLKSMPSPYLFILDVPNRHRGKLPRENNSYCLAKPLSNGENAQEVVSSVISWIRQRRNLKGSEFLVEPRYSFGPFIDRRIGGRQHQNVFVLVGYLQLFYVSFDTVAG